MTRINWSSFSWIAPHHSTHAQAGEFVESVAPQAKEAASNLYDQGSQAGEYVRKHIAQEPLAGMLVAGLIGYGLGYLIHRR